MFNYMQPNWTALYLLQFLPHNQSTIEGFPYCFCPFLSNKIQNSQQISEDESQNGKYRSQMIDAEQQDYRLPRITDRLFLPYVDQQDSAILKEQPKLNKVQHTYDIYCSHRAKYFNTSSAPISIQYEQNIEKYKNMNSQDFEKNKKQKESPFFVVKNHRIKKTLRRFLKKHNKYDDQSKYILDSEESL